MAEILGLGETFVIKQRVVTDEMLDQRATWRRSIGHEDEGAEPFPAGYQPKILRAYIHPILEEPVVAVDVGEGGVTVTPLRRGYALVDVIDEASEPAGVDYEFYVVRRAPA